VSLRQSLLLARVGKALSLGREPLMPHGWRPQPSFRGYLDNHSTCRTTPRLEDCASRPRVVLGMHGAARLHVIAPQMCTVGRPSISRLVNPTRGRAGRDPQRAWPQSRLPSGVSADKNPRKVPRVEATFISSVASASLDLSIDSSVKTLGLQRGDVEAGGVGGARVAERVRLDLGDSRFRG